VVDGPTATIEYAGAAGGRPLHWYASATKKGDLFFLVTATALQGQWADVSTKLMKVVDSFRLEGAE
jgi:hypothetical protein